MHHQPWAASSAKVSCPWKGTGLLEVHQPTICLWIFEIVCRSTMNAVEGLEYADHKERLESRTVPHSSHSSEVVWSRKALGRSFFTPRTFLTAASIHMPKVTIVRYTSPVALLAISDDRPRFPWRTLVRLPQTHHKRESPKDRTRAARRRIGRKGLKEHDSIESRRRQLVK